MTTLVLEEPRFDHDAGFFTAFTPATSVDIASPDTSKSLPVSIAGHEYVLDLAMYQRQSLQPFRPAQDPSPEPGEQTLSVEGVWKRTQFDWRDGAGQQFADDDDSSRSRFYQSRGINPWTRRQACLQWDTWFLSEDGGKELLVLGDWLYTLAGGKVLAYHLTAGGGYAAVEDGNVATPTVGAVTFTDQDYDGAGGSAAIAMATDGQQVYVAAGAAGIFILSVGTPTGVALPLNIAASPVTPTIDHLWFANGWLIGASQNILYSVAADGTLVSIYEHFNSSWSWVSADGAPNAIYVAGTDESSGTVSEIYRIIVSDDGATLNVPVFAGGLALGQTVNAIFFYEQRMVIGTDQGVHAAQIDSAGALSIGPLIEVGEVNHFAAWGGFVWFDGFDDRTFGGHVDGLWRFNLQRESADLVPAYASDLTPPAFQTSNGQPKAIAVWRGYVIFADTDHIWAQSASRYVPTGYLRSGWFGMASPERKVLASGSVRMEQLGDGSSVEMIVEDDAENEVSIGTLDTTGLRGPAADWDGQGFDSELLRIQLVLRASDDQTEGVCVRRHTMRIIPAPASVEEIMCPILMADKVQRKEGGPQLHYDTYAEYRFLKQLENSRQVVNYREGQITYRCTVRNVSIQKPENWSNRNRFFSGTIVVRLITLEGIPPEVGTV